MLTVVLLNTGSVRFDLLEGNFTLNDEKTVSPFPNAFVVMRDVIYEDAQILLDWLNTGKYGYILPMETPAERHALQVVNQQSWERKRSSQHLLLKHTATPGYVTYDGTLLLKNI